MQGIGATGAHCQQTPTPMSVSRRIDGAPTSPKASMRRRIGRGIVHHDFAMESLRSVMDRYRKRSSHVFGRRCGASTPDSQDVSCCSESDTLDAEGGGS